MPQNPSRRSSRKLRTPGGFRVEGLGFRVEGQKLMTGRDGCFRVVSCKRLRVQGFRGFVFKVYGFGVLRL